jgi:CRISPR-associated protein Cmr5
MMRQQSWAKHALARVVVHKDKPMEKKYATLCMKAPSLLRQAGLVQGLAFLQTRSEEGKTLVTDLAVGLKYTDSKALQTAAHDAALPIYMSLTHDVVALATWFRRFAQAELKSEDAPANPGPG